MLNPSFRSLASLVPVFVMAVAADSAAQTTTSQAEVALVAPTKILKPGYVSGVKKSGGYVALAGSGAQMPVCRRHGGPTRNSRSIEVGLWRPGRSRMTS